MKKVKRCKRCETANSIKLNECFLCGYSVFAVSADPPVMPLPVPGTMTKTDTDKTTDVLEEPGRLTISDEGADSAETPVRTSKRSGIRKAELFLRSVCFFLSAALAVLAAVYFFYYN